MPKMLHLGLLTTHFGFNYHKMSHNWPKYGNRIFGALITDNDSIFTTNVCLRHRR